MVGNDDVPANWAVVPLREIAEVRLGRQRSPDKATGEHMRPYLRAANVTWSGLDLSDVKQMNFDPRELEVYALHKDDIVLGEASGSAAEVGKPAIWNNEIQDCCLQNTLIRVRAQPGLAPFLLHHFVHDARSGRFASASRGIGIHHLGAEALSEWLIALPPIAEQRRIVSKLEALTAKSRRAKEALLSAKSLESQLVSYYTRDWPLAELAPHLVERVELAGAAWAEYRTVGLSNTGVICERREAIGIKGATKCKIVRHGDIVFNPIRLSIGSIARYLGDEPAVVSPEYQVFRTKETLSSEVLVRYLRTTLGKSHVDIETQGSVRYRVYFRTLQGLRIPVAPPARQREAERLLLGLRNVFALVNAAIEELPRLERSILAKAFRGELVPQDPSDEPASVLLERIRKEREAAGPTGGRGRKKAAPDKAPAKEKRAGAGSPR